MKICILIPSYKRNRELFRLLGQIRALKDSYEGSNQYTILVADSDPINLQATDIEENCDQRIINPGNGFDENIKNYFLNYAMDFDWTFSISDDDLFSLASIHPFEIIDTATRSKAEVVIFNHIDFRSTNNGKINLLNRHYLEPKLSLDSNFLSAYFLRLLPRHVGLLYSRSAIIRSRPHFSLFNRTLHLYTIPVIQSSLERAVTFFDYPLCYFCVDQKSDGAWENNSLVFDGLLNFLVSLKTVLQPEYYLIAKEGFLVNYLGTNSWLRRDLADSGIRLRSEDEILRLL
jgi:hypothetical protein